MSLPNPPLPVCSTDRLQPPTSTAESTSSVPVDGGAVVSSTPESSPTVPPAAEPRRPSDPFVRANQLARETVVKAVLQEQPWCHQTSVEGVAMIAAVAEPDRALRCTTVFLRYYLQHFPEFAHAWPSLLQRVIRDVQQLEPSPWKPTAAELGSAVVLALGQLPYDLKATELHAVLDQFAAGATMFVTEQLSSAKSQSRGMWFAVVNPNAAADLVRSMDHRVLYASLADDSRSVLHLNEGCADVNRDYRLLAEILAHRDALAVIAKDHIVNQRVTVPHTNLTDKFDQGVWPMTVQPALAPMSAKILATLKTKSAASQDPP